MSGFRIKELKILGSGLETALLEFTEGLNVITGPTGTGKSYIFQCINYMLGSSKKPKAIKEAKGYEKIHLKIISHANIEYTLISDLKGGDFEVINESTKTSERLKRKHSAETTDNISAFLLSLNNLSGKRIRKNNKGKTRSLSFRDLSRFLLIDEVKIIEDSSPIVSGQYTTGTEEKQTFKLIISGKDDNDIIEAPSKDEVKFRRGKIELLTEIIATNARNLEELAVNEDPDQLIDEINLDIESLKRNHNKLNNEFSSLNRIRQDIADSIYHFKTEKVFNDELRKRSNILINQYQSDSKRLFSTIEASKMLIDNPEQKNKCTLCNQTIESIADLPNLNDVISACYLEDAKIQLLIEEAKEAASIIEFENIKLENQINLRQIDFEKIDEEINSDIVQKMEKILARISVLSGKKEKLNQAKYLKHKTTEYQKQLDSLSISIKTTEPAGFDDLLSSDLDDLNEIIESVLLGINYPFKGSVTYSESKNDFVIGGEDRELAGKGLRAITYASFLIALQKIVQPKTYSLGPCILDSPLVTYKKPKSDNEHISDDLAMDFYRYVAIKSNGWQAIILENEEPPSDIELIINHISFSGNNSIGRFGFIPVRND